MDDILSTVHGVLKGALHAVMKFLPFGRIVILVGLPDGRVAYVSNQDTAGYNEVIRVAIGEAEFPITPTHEAPRTVQ